MSGGHSTERPGHPGMRNEGVAGSSGKRAGRGWFLLLFPLLICTILPLTLAYAAGGAAEGGHEGPGWAGFAWKLLNFVVIAGVIYWLAAGKVRDYFTGRRQGIERSLADAVTAREAAEAKFREYDAKLDRATAEIDEVTRMIREQGQAEKERLIAEAQRTAEKIREDTQSRMKQEFSKASHQLQIEAVRLSAQLAEELLRKNIGAQDHDVMVRDYIEKVVRRD